MPAPHDQDPLEIEPESVKSMLDAGEDFLFLYCREHVEHHIVHLAEATLLPMSALLDRHDELTPHRDRRIVVFCHLGARSLHVAAWLRQQGFDRAESMSGGIDRWAAEIDQALPRY